MVAIDLGVHYSLKEAVARFYETEDAEQAADLLRDVIELGSGRSSPFEVRRLACTLFNWTRHGCPTAPPKA